MKVGGNRPPDGYHPTDSQVSWLLSRETSPSAEPQGHLPLGLLVFDTVSPEIMEPPQKDCPKNQRVQKLQHQETTARIPWHRCSLTEGETLKPKQP